MAHRRYICRGRALVRFSCSQCVLLPLCNTLQWRTGGGIGLSGLPLAVSLCEVALWPAREWRAVFDGCRLSSTQLVSRSACFAVARLCLTCFALGLLYCCQCYALLVLLVCRRLRPDVGCVWPRWAGTDGPAAGECVVRHPFVLLCVLLLIGSPVWLGPVLVLDPPPRSGVPRWCCSCRLRGACCVRTGPPTMVGCAVLVRGLPPGQVGVPVQGLPPWLARCVCAWPAATAGRAVLVCGPSLWSGVLCWCAAHLNGQVRCAGA